MKYQNLLYLWKDTPVVRVFPVVCTISDSVIKSRDLAPSFNYVIVKHLNLTQFLWNNLSDVYLWYHIMNVTCSVWKSRSRCSCTCKYWCKYKLYSEPRQSLLCPKVLLIYLHIHACILFCIYVLLQKKICFFLEIF